MIKFAVFGAILSPIFVLLPNPTDMASLLESSSGFMSLFWDYIVCAAYLLPMNTVINILGVTMLLMTWRVIVSIARTLWDVLPLV